VAQSSRRGRRENETPLQTPVTEELISEVNTSSARRRSSVERADVLNAPGQSRQAVVAIGRDQTRDELIRTTTALLEKTIYSSLDVKETLKSRLLDIQRFRNLWLENDSRERDTSAALKHLISRLDVNSNNQSSSVGLYVDVLDSLDLRAAGLSLSQLPPLLNIIEECLVHSGTSLDNPMDGLDRSMEVVCTALLTVLELFSDIINDIRKAPSTDLSSSERLERANRSHEALLRIQSHLTIVQRRHKRSQRLSRLLLKITSLIAVT
jgi:hypothetical protein